MCQNCSFQSTFKCGACAQVEYCSENCAETHWYSTHQYECVGARDKRTRGEDDDTWEDGDGDIFVLITEKDERVEIKRHYLKKSNTLRLLADTNEIDIPNIKIFTLRQIVTFLESNNFPKFTTDEHLYDFLNAAYYLDIIDFDYTDLMLRNDVFGKLKKINGGDITLSIDIINRYLIPFTKVSLFKLLQKNNFILWSKTARPFSVKLIGKLFPKAIPKASEDELMTALYKYDKAIDKFVPKNVAIETYQLEEMDLKTMPVENGQYRLYNVLEAVLVKYQTTLDLYGAREVYDRKVRMIRSKNTNKKSEKRLNEEKARFEKRSPLKDVVIQEAKQKLLEKYQNTFDQYFDKYKEDIEAWADSTDLLIEYIFYLVKNAVASQINLSFNFKKEVILIILDRYPKVFELYLKQVPDKANTETVKLANFIQTKINMLNNMFEKIGFADTKNQIIDRWLIFVSNEQNAFGFERFQSFYINQFNQDINEMIQNLDYSGLRKILTDDKFKELVLEIAGKEQLFYFKDLKLEKK